ncbi:hypothetical protein ACWF0M_12435 [Kribbella sp. NPDC055110]
MTGKTRAGSRNQSLSGAITSVAFPGDTASSDIATDSVSAGKPVCSSVTASHIRPTGIRDRTTFFASTNSIDPSAFWRAVRPLVRNAIRHTGTTPSAGRSFTTRSDSKPDLRASSLRSTPGCTSAYVAAVPSIVGSGSFQGAIHST